MYTSTLLYLLPLISIPLFTNAIATLRPGSVELESRELYDATNRQIRDAHLSHVNGARSPVAAGDGSSHDGMKVIRRKKKSSKRSCPAASSSSTSTSTTIAAVVGAAVKTSSTSSQTSTTTAHATSTSASSTGTKTASSSKTSSSASSSSAAASTSSAVSSGSELFPWGTGSAHWTTSSGGLSFTSALKPLSYGSLPSSGSAPDGSSALIASYPSGTVGLSGSGYSFYTEGQHNGVNVESASEVSFSYSVYFQDGFQFNKGGKMPGLYGGTSLSEAKSCSGGRQEGRDSCFSARLMWRTNGAGEIYDYLPVQYTGTDDGYGESINRGAYSWATGKWQTVAMRVKLNDAGQANGEQELYVDGQSVISLTGVTFSTDSSTKIYGIMAQTFFGGHTSDWASPQDQKAYFKDWSLAILA